MGDYAVPHLNELAELGWYVQMINPFDLRDCLDASTDLRHDLGDTMEEDFPILLIEKEKDQTPYWKHCVGRDGIRWPVVIVVMDDGSWQMDDGHNRLKFGLLNNLDVPVVFDDSGAGEESTLRYDIMIMMEGEPCHNDDGPAGWQETVKIDKRDIARLIPFPRTGELPMIVSEAR